MHVLVLFTLRMNVVWLACHPLQKDLAHLWYLVLSFCQQKLKHLHWCLMNECTLNSWGTDV